MEITERSPLAQTKIAINERTFQQPVKTERHAREIAERSLGEAQAAIRDLQTKLGHAVLVRDEARADAECAKTARLGLETALAVEHNARQTADQCLIDAADASRRKVGADTKSPAEASAPLVTNAKSSANTDTRGRTARSQPKPVKWWLQSK